MTDIINWIVSNYIELLGALLGIVGVSFQIKQNVWVWPINILASVMYVVIFLNAQLYALMSLQFYFIAVGIYGWYQWKHPKPKDGIVTNELSITSLKLKTTILYSSVLAVFWVLLYWFLKEYTNDSAPILESLITAMSLVASLMLAKKIIEQWLLWFIADAIAVGLYISQHLYPTAVFYFILVIMAIIGYYQWKKEMT